MIGETDFTGVRHRVGICRTYVELAARPTGDAGYRDWLDAVKAGRLYFGDGLSHLMDFTVNGSAGPVQLAEPGPVMVSVEVAAFLPDIPTDLTDPRHAFYIWHLERARIGTSRMVPLEIVVNSRVVARREVLADGDPRTWTFEIDLPRSGWIAVRVLPSSHTAPIVVTVAGEPVRASRRSARWCLDRVDELWRGHTRRIRPAERPDAEDAWAHAPGTYATIADESEVD